MVTTTTTRVPGSRKTLCRGERHVLHMVPSSEGPSVYKIPVADTPTHADVASLQNELFATRDLNIQGVRRGLRMERVDGRPALVLAYAPGEALVPRRVQTRADLRSTLDMAVRVCRILGELHGAGVIHKNLQPSHILFDPVSHEVSLIGMRFAARVDLKQAHLASPKQLQGTLAYMSPEQTGRMNRVVDYRADLYSLGVTLYELLTGRLPFDSADPLELVHCHIAKTPLPANSVNPEVPSAVSLLVSKLLSKSADDRYQSAFGLSHDLEKCLSHLHESGTVDIFPLAALDRSGRFRLPHKLYGRASQADQLCRAFERASDGRCELVLVAGGSGVGKSALVHEVLRSLGEKRGSFAEGKFEQLLRNIPYHALVQAFKSILGRVLTEDNTSLAAFRERILPATSGVGKVLTDLVPTLELIIGEQPPAPDVGGEEMQNRFLRALTQFVQALAPREHPMVLFLDDLQWADSASLALLKVLLTDARTRNVLFVAAYRDQEVTPGHPLGQFLTEIRKAAVPVETIHLTNLTPEDVQSLTADSLQTDLDKAQPLADVVFEKTGGNAFFVGQFLQSLAAPGLLKFDHQDQTWHWNLSEVRRAATASDVLELIGERLRRLPASTLRALQIASCVGARFKLEKVATTSSETSAQVLHDLWPAVEAGLLRPESDGFPLAGADFDTEVDAVTEFSFVHDRVQQAAYASLAEETRQSVHLSIGRSALKQLTADSAAGQVFDVVNQLNAGVNLVTTESERLELAHLNLRAGRAARDSVAFRQATEYFKAGQSLLGKTPWQTHYPIMVALRGGQAEAASCVGEEQEAETAAREVLLHGVTPADKDLAYHALQTVARMRDRLDESLALGLEALEQYGVRFPKNPGGHHIGMEMVRIRWLMRGRTIESLGDAPEMRDPNAIAAMRMMDRINVTAFRAGSKIYPLLLLRQLQLTLEHGNMDLSPSVFSAYAIALCGFLGDIAQGTRFGELALRLQHRYPEELTWRRADYIWGTFLGHWSRPIQETFPLIHRASQARLNLGETFNAAFCAFTESAWRFLSGEVLSEVAENIESQNDFVEKIDGARSIQRMLWQTVENLTSPGVGERAHAFNGPRFDEASATIGAADSDKTSACIYHILRLYLSYLFGAYNEAVYHAAEAEKRVESIVSMPLVPFLKQFGALARIAAARARGDELSLADAVRVRRALGSFRKWAAFGPANYAHRLALLEAEMARRPARGSTHGVAALDLYERAISLARTAGSLADEALALELAAESAAAAGDTSVASALFDRAVFTYRKWGARSKADVLVRSKSDLGLISSRETRDTGPKSEIGGAHGSLDMASLMKASAAMAEEIVMDRLLGRLIEILAENAGAERGALLFAGVYDLTLEAERGSNGVVQVRRATPLAQADTVCEAIVRYVARTQELLVLDDAMGDGRFRAIPYIQNRAVHSVLCMPIKHQGKFLGVLYLENNLVGRAFTAERRQVLDLLAAQAAVSLENARVYETLEERVAVRTKELRHSNDELASTLARLREAQQQLITQEKLASLGALTSGIAHEIKNPLNFVNNFSELSIELLDELLAGMEPDTKTPLSEDEVADTLADIRLNIGKVQEHGRRADGIIRSMLDHARVAVSDLQDTDLNSLAGEYAKLAHYDLRSRGQTIDILLETRFAPDLPKVHAAPQELGRVILNLVHNAAYAVASKREKLGPSFTPTVTLSTRALPGTVELRVRDNGPGIAKDIRDKVFDPFFTTKPAGDGTGLGLSISHDIVVQRHGGTIHFDSVEGEYTEFVVSLPAASPI